MQLKLSTWCEVETYLKLSKDIILSLTGHGFTHLFFLNGHGGNIDSIKAAFSEIYSEHSLSQKPCSTHLNICNGYEGKRVTEISSQFFKEAEGCHATPSEISLAFYACPDEMKKADLSFYP